MKVKHHGIHSQPAIKAQATTTSRIPVPGQALESGYPSFCDTLGDPVYVQGV